MSTENDFIKGLYAREEVVEAIAENCFPIVIDDNFYMAEPVFMGLRNKLVGYLAFDNEGYCHIFFTNKRQPKKHLEHMIKYAIDSGLCDFRYPHPFEELNQRNLFSQILDKVQS